MVCRRFLVREASTKDYADVEKLVKTLDLSENLLRDLKQFNKAKRDDVSEREELQSLQS